MKRTLSRSFCNVVASLFMALLLTAFCSCHNDDEQMPPVMTDLACLEIGSDGIVNFMNLDNGEHLGLANKLKSEVSDTTLRCLCMYSLEEGMARIYSAKTIFSREASPRSEFDTTAVDPVKFVSAWRTPHFLNINIGVMTTGAAPHNFAFCLDTIAENVNGNHRIAYFTFMHQRPTEDAESYTSDVFMSLPLDKYAGCDSVSLTINTYNGPRTIVR